MPICCVSGSSTLQFIWDICDGCFVIMINIVVTVIIIFKRLTFYWVCPMDQRQLPQCFWIGRTLSVFCLSCSSSLHTEKQTNKKTLCNSINIKLSCKNNNLRAFYHWPLKCYEQQMKTQATRLWPTTQSAVSDKHWLSLLTNRLCNKCLNQQQTYYCISCSLFKTQTSIFF